MRIAQVSPLIESVPPRLYGGTERVVHHLTEALVADGHEVTLFASGDSMTSAELVAVVPEALRLSSPGCNPTAAHVLMVERVQQLVEEFDVVHWHIDHLHFPLTRRWPLASLTTMHGRLDLPELVALFREFDTEPLASISDAQRAPLPWVNWIGTVHHGLPLDLYRLERNPSDYLVFLGRISRDKRPDRAIEIARRTGMKLKIAAKVDPADRAYFEQEIVPLLERSPHAEFLGEVGDAEKGALLGGARALLFPIDWPEPFGLVMIEAMACGTPVIAFSGGSVREIVAEGVTGFVVENLEQATRAVERLDRISRAACRSEFEQRFSAQRMARDYVAIYEVLSQARRISVLKPPFRRQREEPASRVVGGFEP